MTVQLADLQDARPDEVAFCGAAYDTLAAALETHVDHFDQVVRAAQAHWTGPAAARVQPELIVQHQQLAAAHEEILAVGVLLHEAAAAIAQAQNDLAHAITDAAAAGCTIAADGTVTGARLEGADRDDKDAIDVRAETADRHARRIAAALTAADEADNLYSARLYAIAAHALDSSGLTTAVADKDLSSAFPPKSDGAKAVNAWWKRLSPAEQQMLLSEQPQVIGNLDGVPAIVRDKANRRYLDQLITQLGGLDLSGQDRTTLQGLEAIRARLDSWDPANEPPIYLLGLGTQGQGRAILSYGNPDTAQNTAVFVPGTGTMLASIGGGNADRALNVYTAALRANDRQSFASMVWLGYDAPLLPDTNHWADSGAVADISRARSGGSDLSAFLNGLRATHTGAQTHITAIGHSYGSTLVGQAGALPGGSGADDLVLIGSPGTGVSHASQLGVGADHVWVGAAPSDPVTHLPSQADAGAGILTTGLAGPVAGAIAGDAAGHLDPDQLWYGQDPASAGFGARTFQVPDGSWTHVHSDYLPDPGTSSSSSILNIGRVVAGRYDAVTLVAPR